MKVPNADTFKSWVPWTRFPPVCGKCAPPPLLVLPSDQQMHDAKSPGQERWWNMFQSTWDVLQLCLPPSQLGGWFQSRRALMMMFMMAMMTLAGGSDRIPQSREALEVRDTDITFGLDWASVGGQAFHLCCKISLFFFYFAKLTSWARRSLATVRPERWWGEAQSGGSTWSRVDWIRSEWIFVFFTDYWSSIRSSVGILLWRDLKVQLYSE